jgi:hypothetical protein
VLRLEAKTFHSVDFKAVNSLTRLRVYNAHSLNLKKRRDAMKLAKVESTRDRSGRDGGVG